MKTRIPQRHVTKKLLLLILVLAQLPFGAACATVAAHDEVYEVRKGDTLWALGESYYGNRHYSKIIAAHNNIASPRGLRAGQKLRLSKLEVILADEGLNTVAKDEMGRILSAREKYMSVEKKLWRIRMRWIRKQKGGFAAGPIPQPEAVRTALLGAASDIDKAIAGFKTKKEGVVNPPKKLIGQLEKLHVNLDMLAHGRVTADSYEGYDIDMVHQRIVLAFDYAIIWARNGFAQGK